METTDYEFHCLKSHDFALRYRQSAESGNEGSVLKSINDENWLNSK